MKNKIIHSFEDVDFLNEDLRESLGFLFSEKFGIVNGILRRYDLHKFGWAMFQSLSSFTSTLFNLSRNVSSGGLGVDKDESLAFVKCFGEAVERYCMSYTNDSELILSKYNLLPQKYRLSKFNLYSKLQYRNLSDIFLDPLRDPIYWTKITEYKTQKNYIYYPACLVYLPFEKQKIVAESSSTGVSAHFNLNKAVLSGVLEIIERDAIMINHVASLPIEEIDMSTITGKNEALVKKMKRDHFQIRLIKLRSDIQIPILQGIIWKGSGSKIHYGIGACASIDIDIAIEKTIQECLFAFFYSKDLLHLRQEKISDITKLYEHFLYYQGDNFAKLPYKNLKIVAYRSEKYTQKYLFQELKRNGLKVYYKDLTTKDVGKSGFKVIRTVIPGMVDLNKTHRIQREGADRYMEVPKRIGVSFKKIDFYKLPHPFP